MRSVRTTYVVLYMQSRRREAHKLAEWVVEQHRESMRGESCTHVAASVSTKNISAGRLITILLPGFRDKHT